MDNTFSRVSVSGVHAFCMDNTFSCVSVTGVHAFCMDNTFSRFSSKLVYFFLSSYIPEEWKKFTAELQQFDLSVHNFTVSHTPTATSI